MIEICGDGLRGDAGQDIQIALSGDGLKTAVGLEELVERDDAIDREENYSG